MGLTYQSAVHIEQEQLIDLPILAIGRKEKDLLPRIRIQPDLVLPAALSSADVDTVDGIVTAPGGGMCGTRRKGGELNA